MRPIHLLSFLATSVLIGCASVPAQPSLVVDSTSANPQIVVIERGRLVNEDEMICHWEAKTGTRLQTKVCLTRAQRALLAEESQQFLKKIQHNATIAPNR